MCVYVYISFTFNESKRKGNVPYNTHTTVHTSIHLTTITTYNAFKDLTTITTSYLTTIHTYAFPLLSTKVKGKEMHLQPILQQLQHTYILQQLQQIQHTSYLTTILSYVPSFPFLLLSLKVKERKVHTRTIIHLTTITTYNTLILQHLQHIKDLTTITTYIQIQYLTTLQHLILQISYLTSSIYRSLYDVLYGTFFPFLLLSLKVKERMYTYTHIHTLFLSFGYFSFFLSAAVDCLGLYAFVWIAVRLV